MESRRGSFRGISELRCFRCSVLLVRVEISSCAACDHIEFTWWQRLSDRSCRLYFDINVSKGRR